MRNLTEEKRERRRAQQRKGLLSRAEMSALKHQQVMAYEKRNSPDAIWDRLLNGRTFDSYEMKTVVI